MARQPQRGAPGALFKQLSMARNPELEAILQARYELETCEPGQKTERRAKLDALLEAAVAKAGSKSLTSRALIEITAEAYLEFKLARKKAERARLSRLR
jgi:hypothetical protein